MRVLVVSHLYPAPGHERHLFVHEQMRELARAGVEVHVLSPIGFAPRPLWRFSARLQRRGHTPRRSVRDGVTIDYPRVLAPPRRALFDRLGVLFSLTLRRLVPDLRARHFDLVHAHQAHARRRGGKAPRGRARRTVCGHSARRGRVSASAPGRTRGRRHPHRARRRPGRDGHLQLRGQAPGTARRAGPPVRRTQRHARPCPGAGGRPRPRLARPAHGRLPHRAEGSRHRARGARPRLGRRGRRRRRRAPSTGALGGRRRRAATRRARRRRAAPGPGRPRPLSRAPAARRGACHDGAGRPLRPAELGRGVRPRLHRGDGPGHPGRRLSRRGGRGLRGGWSEWLPGPGRAIRPPWRRS